MKNIVDFIHKLYLISAFVGWCTNYTNVYGKDNKMLLHLVWEIKWRISFRVKFTLRYENCLQKSHNFSVWKNLQFFFYCPVKLMYHCHLQGYVLEAIYALWCRVKILPIFEQLLMEYLEVVNMRLPSIPVHPTCVTLHCVNWNLKYESWGLRNSHGVIIKHKKMVSEISFLLVSREWILLPEFCRESKSDQNSVARVNTAIWTGVARRITAIRRVKLRISSLTHSLVHTWRVSKQEPFSCAQ